MTYKAKIAVCSEIRTKPSTQSEHHAEILSIKPGGRLRLKCNGTCAETRFRLSTKWTSPFKWARAQFIRLLAGELCTSACSVCTARASQCSAVM
jgi:hypothetical protein